MLASSRVIQVTPVMDTSAYANGDLWFDTTAITFPGELGDCIPWLVDVQVLDQDDQSLMVFDIYILRSNVSMGTFNAAPTISDANALEIISRIRFDGSASPPDGVDLTGSKLYSKSAGNAPLPIMCKPASGNLSTLYVAGVVVTGTPTNTATGVKVKLGFYEQR